MNEYIAEVEFIFDYIWVAYNSSTVVPNELIMQSVGVECQRTTNQEDCKQGLVNLENALNFLQKIISRRHFLKTWLLYDRLPLHHKLGLASTPILLSRKIAGMTKCREPFPPFCLITLKDASTVGKIESKNKSRNLEFCL